MRMLLKMAAVFLCLAVGITHAAELTPIGAAKVDITPGYPIRLSGYGNRRQEATEVLHKIYARALAIGGESPAVLIAVENCGVPAVVTEAVCAKIREQNGVPRERIVICSTHTHAGPYLAGNLPGMFGEALPAAHQEHVNQYTRELTEKIVQVAREALAARKPGQLYYASGSAGFAMNRRGMKEGKYTGFGEQANGPVDRSLPILVAKDESGKLIAVVANYACHCTTLGGDFNKVAGDWAGVAADAIEAENPGCVSLVTIGCGADANPSPRGTPELAEKHGQTLAAEIKRLLGGELAPLTPQLACRLEHVDLPFAKLPTREQLEERAKKSGAEGYHAKLMLVKMEGDKKLPESVSYPIGVWTFGKDLGLVFLGGEVVVDYAIRLKSEVATEKLWVTAYANDVPCYIASQRILREGGYEADYSMLYYAQPTRLAAAAETTIVEAVSRILPEPFHAAAKSAEFPGPKSPAEELATFTTKPDLAIELVAAEPLVVDPVAFDWGRDGKLWVLEMRDYPMGLDGKGKPGGRVKVLEDTNADGRYDKATVFLDDIPFPTGIKVWRQGVLVCAAPRIFYAEDTKGTGQADKIETLYEGFGEGNQQHRVNGLRWGLDGWLYVGNGDSGGRIKSLRGGEPIDMSGRDLRIRPDTGEFEAQSGRTQYGINRDDWGHWFGGNNTEPIWHYVLDDHYLRRNRRLIPPQVTKPVPERSGSAPVYPTSQTQARFNDHTQANHFTSACSPEIYRDHYLGEKYYGNAFICEPVHNLVHREVMRPSGVTFTSSRAADEQTSEFLSSSDNCFRPAMIRTGPDGALWIADMYRQVIEHPKWIPAEWQKRLDVRAGDDKGRIWRVVNRAKPPGKMPALEKAKTAELIDSLRSRNGVVRDMAQQEIVWRGDKAIEPVLAKLFADEESPETRLQVLYTHELLGVLTPTLLMKALHDPHAEVRRHAVRLAEAFFEGRGGENLRYYVTELAKHDDPSVRLQVAYTLGEFRRPGAGGVLAEMLVRDGRDPYLRAAAFSSFTSENIGDVVAGVLAAHEENKVPGEMVGQVLSQAAQFGPGALPEALAIVVVSKKDHFETWRLSALATILDAMEREKQTLVTLGNEKTRANLRELYVQARATVESDEALLPERIAAARILGRGLDEREADVARLGAILSPRQAPELQEAAVATLGRLSGPLAPAEMLKHWAACTPATRGRILDALLSHDDWIEPLLAAVEKGDVLPAQIDARRRQQLLAHKAKDVRERAEKLLAGGVSSSRQELVAKYQEALKTDANAVQGKEVFAKRCAACHKLGDVGNAVGPDLATVTGKPPAVLLEAILDPNRAVEDRYLDYVVNTTGGRSLSGMLAAETATSITLALPDGKQEAVLRSDIEVIKGTGRSFMPEGLERDLSPQDVNDVIAFVRSFGPPPKEFRWGKPELVNAAADGTLHLRATSARVYGATLVLEEKYKNVGYWHSADDRVSWTCTVPAAGKYRVELDFACEKKNAGNVLVVTLGEKSLRHKVPSTGTWDDYQAQTIGPVELPAGTLEVSAMAGEPIRGAVMDLREIRLVPMKK